MNELEMVRDLLKEPPPPAPAAAAGALGRLEREMTGRGRRVTRTPPRSRRLRRLTPRLLPRRTRGRRWMLGTGLLAATAAATAAVITVTSLTAGGGGPASRRPAVRPAELSARSTLLAAAESTSRTATGHGPYWLTDEVQGWIMMVRGPAGPYVVEQRKGLRQWVGTGGRPSWGADRDLGARPQRPADMAAWRKAGSPSRWPLPHSSNSWTTRPSRWKTAKAPVPLSFANGSVAHLRRLPADPARLRAYFLGMPQHGHEGTISDARWLYESVYELFSEPAPANVRAAAYRMLAQEPGIRDAGTVVDPLGRPGRAVALPESGPPSFEHRLIVDTATGRLLAEETVQLRPTAGPGDDLAESAAPAGTILSYRAMRQAVWTPTAP
ncbi:MAG TPA: CU044_5270 family protein [Streptosporangiaceae bacterium]